MIVLGVTPGVRSLAYCVLLVRRGATEPEVIDSDLLKGGDPGGDLKKETLAKKSKPHALTLEVVLERAFDLAKGTAVLLAIGPGSGKEPPEHVLFVRALLAGITVELAELGMRIDCVSWTTPEELDEVLGIGVKKAVRRSLNRQGTTLIRSPYVLAAGTALAGLELLKKSQQVRQFAS